MQNAPPFLIAKEFLIFQQTFCYSEVGTGKGPAFVHCRHKAYLLPIAPQVWVVSSGTLYQEIPHQFLSLEPAGPLLHLQDVRSLGKVSRSPELQQPRWRRAPVQDSLRPPCMCPGAGSLSAPLTLQSRPALTRKGASPEERFPTRGRKGTTCRRARSRRF